MFCNKCGAALLPDAAFCPNCGAAITPALYEPLRPILNPTTRVRAFLLDKLFLFFAVMLGMAVAYQSSAHAAVIAGAFLPWLYYAGFESSSWQGTPGKALSGLKVIRTNGEPLSFPRATLRYLVKAISLGVWIGAVVSLALIAFTDSQQALHDKAADSKVVPQ